MRYRLTLTALAGPAVAQSPAGTPQELLARMGQTYAAFDSTCQMRAEVSRHTVAGGMTRDTKRDFRFYQKGSALRLESGPPKDALVLLRRADGGIVEHSRNANLFAVREPGAQTAAEATLLRCRNILQRRFAGLAATEPTITSAKEEEFRHGKERRNCLRIGLKGSTWTATIWVERSSALVWHSTMRAQREAGLDEEEITWFEIEDGKGLPPDMFEFEPPHGAKRVPRLLTVPLH
ncbi:MAG: hypothetical protein U0Q16_36165 [Bryobacteraceae bacterium]